MNESKLKIINENGKFEEYKILFTFRCEELDNDYIAFTNENVDEEGKGIIYIAYYNPDEELNELVPVTDENELKMAYEVLEEVLKTEKA